MEALLNRYRNLTVLVVAILAQLILLAYQVKTNQDVRLIRVWAVTAITPIANVLEVVRQHTIGLAEDYFVLVNVREQNRKLTDEIGRLKLDNHFLRSELQTAERAKLLSAFQERTPSRTLAARIIGNATGTNSRVVFVDRGSVNGVMRGMAVVTPDGIVGKVISAYPTASQVQLITDENFAAGVISQKHRVHGTLKGKGQNKPIVDYVQNEEPVEQGEIFFTSGDDRVFPKGLPVGAATAVRPGKNFKEIYIMPAAFQQGEFEEVLIVLEGVHQALPEPTAVASNDIKILAAPPADSREPQAQPQDMRSGLNTEADKLRDKYKRIGEMQNHKFGEGLPGSKPPDFNVDPDKAKQAGQAAAAGAGAAVGAARTEPPAANQAKPPITTPPQPRAAAPPATLPSTSAGAGGAGVPAAKPSVTTAAKPPLTTALKPPMTTTVKPPVTTAAKPPAATATKPPSTSSVKPPLSGSNGTTAASSQQTVRPAPGTAPPSAAKPKPQTPAMAPARTPDRPARPREENSGALPIP